MFVKRTTGESGAIVVDDQSPLIGYLGDWSDITTGNQAINNGSLKELDASGGGFFISFTGSQIQVFGVVRNAAKGKANVPITSTYSIDGTQVGTYTAPNLTQEADGIAFFNSGIIPVAFHTLTVTVNGASESSPYLFDYVLFTPAPTITSDALPIGTSSIENPFTISSHPTSSGSLTGAALTFGASASSESSSSSSSSSTSSSAAEQSTSAGSPVNDLAAHSSSHTGPIVGGVVGGVAFLVIVLGLLWWWMRRKRTSSGNETMAFEDKPLPAVGGSGGIPGVTPYLLPRNYNSDSANFVARETSAPLAPGSVLGRPDTPSSGIPRKAPLPEMNSPSSSANFYGSQQQLVTGSRSGPSEISSGSGSGGASSIAFAHDQMSNHGGSVYDGPASGRPTLTSKSARSPPQASRPPPAVHADSGLRFRHDVDPDEVLSQVTTQLPAYSEYRPNR